MAAAGGTNSFMESGRLRDRGRRVLARVGGVWDQVGDGHHLHLNSGPDWECPNWRAAAILRRRGNQVKDRGAALMPLVGVAELARLLRRDPKAIRFAVERGRITRRPDGLFDADQALAEWKANTLHERSHSNNVLEMAPANESPLENERPAKASDYAKARAAAQIYEARLKKLRYEEKAKNLVPARDVADAAYRTVSCLREACMNIPARVAAQLAIETDQARCYAIIEAEVIAIFTDYAEDRIASV